MVDKNEVRKKRIGVLMGGLSAEREISLKTGKAIYDALKRLGYNVLSIDVGRDICQRLMEERIEIAFIALHGRYGEDGCIQGLLEFLKIPYTGSGITASALSLNKVMAKRVFASAGLKTPASQVLFDRAMLEEISIPYPFIVKPATGGSTIGVKKVEKFGDIKSAVDDAFMYSSSVMVEEFINGSEVTVGILEGRVFAPIEIRPKAGLYDYNAKYKDGMTEYLVPAPLEKEVCEKAKDMALRAYHTIGCRGAARVDMIVNGIDLWLLEINTIPGMTETSLLPKAAAIEGLSFDRLVEEILFTARLGD